MTTRAKDVLAALSLLFGIALIAYTAADVAPAPPVALARATASGCDAVNYRDVKYNNRVVADAYTWCSGISTVYLRVALSERFRDGQWHRVATSPWSRGGNGRTYAGTRSTTCRVGAWHEWFAAAQYQYYRNGVLNIPSPAIRRFNAPCG